MNSFKKWRAPSAATATCGGFGMGLVVATGWHRIARCFCRAACPAPCATAAGGALARQAPSKSRLPVLHQGLSTRSLTSKLLNVALVTACMTTFTAVLWSKSPQPDDLRAPRHRPERRRGRPSTAAGSAAEERPSVVASTEARQGSCSTAQQGEGGP